MKLMSNYDRALIDAIMMMDEFPDLEPKSALKQCASDYGIAYGEEMGKFINWAMEEL
jgi:hypothetical protein